MSLILKNIKQIVGIQNDLHKKVIKGDDLKKLTTLENGYIKIKDGIIEDFGKMENLVYTENYEEIDAHNKLVLPAWCDSHTHIVYAGTREEEFVDRIKGLTYQEIALKGGGILNSAKKLANASEEDLYRSAKRRLDEVKAMGTGAIEIKSGYGLSLESELKMLRVIKKLKENSDITIKSTLLAAHAFPEKYKQDQNGYIRLIIDEIIPEVASQKLADYIDVFCETNYFSVSQMHLLLEAGIKYGLKPKVHVNQFTSIEGIQKAIQFGAISVDHLEVMEEDDIEALTKSNTIPTILPTCSFFLKIPYAPARDLIHNGLPLCIASDYNPGSTPSGNIPFAMSLACIYQGLFPEETINATTLNGAAALELSNTLGSITVGKMANLIITKEIPSYHFIPYSFGTNHIDNIILKGKVQFNS